MIKSLKISNFQSHKATNLVFDKGVNIIVGTSDSGKTAILRALKWVATNRPSGDAFRSTWGGETSVVLETDKATISRSKDNTKNAYTLVNGSNNGFPVVFEAFGTNIPIEIESALNLSKTNLQQQLDSPFLLSETSGEVAAHFNKIAHLEVIDLASQRIDKWIRENKANINFKESSKKEQETLLPKFEYLTKFEIDLEVLEGMEQKMIRYMQDIRAVQTLIDKYRQTEIEISNYSQFLGLEKQTNALSKLIEDRSKKREEYKVLRNHLTSIQAINTSLTEFQTVQKYSKAVDNIILLFPARDSYKKEIRELESFLYNLTKIEDSLSARKVKLHQKEILFKKEMPAVCPLCGTKLKEK